MSTAFHAFSPRSFAPALRAASVLLAVMGIVGCSASAPPIEADLQADGEDAEGAGQGEGVGQEGGMTVVPEDEFEESLAAPGSVLVANSPGSVTTTGVQRFMVALPGSGVPYLGDAQTPATVLFYAPGADFGGEASAAVEATFVTTTESQVGVYVVDYSFPEAGAWGVGVDFDGTRLDPVLFEVAEQSSVPQPGTTPRPLETPTATSWEEMIEITTDPLPDIGYYDLTVAEALSNGQPTVVAFASPAFCQTALCGPTLATVKAATENHPDIDVVHVEPFDVAKAMEGTLEVVPAMTEWGLLSEPWVFVFDAEGKLVRSFEGLLSTEELSATLAGR